MASPRDWFLEFLDRIDSLEEGPDIIAEIEAGIDELPEVMDTTDIDILANTLADATAEAVLLGIDSRTEQVIEADDQPLESP